jgi:hypothetical protein
MTLPADVARCLGYGATECNACRRRTDPPHERQVWTGPWELEGVPCEMRIPVCTTQSITLNTTPSTRQVLSASKSPST